MKQNRRYLNALKPLLRSKSLSGMCAKLHSVSASNNRDHEITLVVTISKYYQLFTSFTNIIDVTHQDHSTGITLLLLVRATYIWAGFLRCFRDPNRVPRIENRVARIRENYHRIPRIIKNRVSRISC